MMVQGTGVPWSLPGITVTPWRQPNGVQLPPSLPFPSLLPHQEWGRGLVGLGHGATGTVGSGGVPPFPGRTRGRHLGVPWEQWGCWHWPETAAGRGWLQAMHGPSMSLAARGATGRDSGAGARVAPSASPCPSPGCSTDAPPIPPALTHRGGGQRLPPHQLPRPQPVEEVTELALGTQPRGGEDEPVWDGAERCHGAPPCAGHVPQRPPGPPRHPRLCARSLRAVGAVAVGAAVSGLAAALPGDPGPHLHRDAGLGAPPDVAAQLFGASLCTQRCGVSMGSRQWRTAAGGAWPKQPPGTSPTAWPARGGRVCPLLI